MLSESDKVDGREFLDWVAKEAKHRGVTKISILDLFGHHVASSTSRIAQGKTRPPRNWREYVENK